VTFSQNSSVIRKACQLCAPLSIPTPGVRRLIGVIAGSLARTLHGVYSPRRKVAVSGDCRQWLAAGQPVYYGAYQKGENILMQQGLNRVLGSLLVLLGIAVFLVRLHHAGSYMIPGGGNLLAGVLALVIGAGLLSPWSLETGTGRVVSWIGIAVGPVVLFFALYATLAEMEEVVSIKALDRDGKPANLRLWVVDYQGAQWVTMPASKSDNHGLEEGPVTLFREGVDSCVMATRLDDREIVDDIHHRRHQKYQVQRLATTMGLFGEDANPNTITLRLDPCPGVK
jgi:hypothetical protein